MNRAGVDPVGPVAPACDSSDWERGVGVAAPTEQPGGGAAKGTEILMKTQSLRCGGGRYRHTHKSSRHKRSRHKRMRSRARHKRMRSRGRHKRMRSRGRHKRMRSRGRHKGTQRRRRFRPVWLR